MASFSRKPNQEEKIDDVDFPSDPSYSGPGLWFAIHLMGYHAITTDKIEAFIEFVETLSENHPCGDCRRHMQDYLNKVPIRSSIGIYDDSDRHIGMFKWSWQFHNAVNARLGKKHVLFAAALQMYSHLEESPLCDLSCGSQSHSDSEEISSDESDYGYYSSSPNNDSYSLAAANRIHQSSRSHSHPSHSHSRPSHSSHAPIPSYQSKGKKGTTYRML